MRNLFGTDGIRGKAREYPLDTATMYALGESLAHRLKDGSSKPRVLMGVDTRESGPDIARALIAGLAAGGGEGVFIGVIPTPGDAYLCRTSDALAAISISASHNPYQDNGVKIFGHDGMKLPDAVEEQIEEEMLAIRRDDVAAALCGATIGENKELIDK
jgi:phosphoglucosamine mutase